MNFEQIRTLVITALFSDQVLYAHLVLKGGNALDLVYGVIDRGSLDIDCSIEGEFEDINDIRRRVFASLEPTFDEHDLVVFDQRFKVAPRSMDLTRSPGGEGTQPSSS